VTKLFDELRSEPILLAHQPLCGRYDDHLIEVRGRKVCMGCATVYPAVLGAFPALAWVRPGFLPSFVLSLALFAVQPLRFVSSHGRARTFLNALLGCSLAAALYSAIACPSELRILVYPFIAAVIVGFEYLKGRRALSRCQGCPARAAFPRCVREPMDLEEGE
jgi:hypothetical protein